MDEADVGQESLVVLGEVDEGGVTGQTGAAGLGPGHLQQRDVKLPTPSEHLLLVRLLQVPGDAAGAGKGLSAQTAAGVRTGPDEAEAEEEPQAVRKVMIQLYFVTTCLTLTRLQIDEILADSAHHEVSGDAGVLHLKLVSVSFQDVKADSFASVELGANSAFRNTKTAAQTFEFVVPPEG